MKARFGAAATQTIQAHTESVCEIERRQNSFYKLDNKPGGVLPYLGYIGMCSPKGYNFSAVLVINRVSILANFGHFGHK